MKIAIAGKAEKTTNYVRYVSVIGAEPIVALGPEEMAGCQGLLLPGGGDITPAFYGEQNHGSTDIDTELDILQLQAFHLAVQKGVPVLGICKGLQIINVGLGGTLIQNLESSMGERHRYYAEDKYHESVIKEGTWLHNLYSGETIVNSAHHQAIDRLGQGLFVVSRCPMDDCIEAIAHESLPIIGVQWHPERIDFEKSGTDGGRILKYFAELIHMAGHKTL